MSNPMMGPRMPMGGPQGGLQGGGQGNPQAVASKMGEMQSIFNPADVAAMVQRGEINPQTPFVQVLAKLGISPNDTLQQVIEKTMRSRENANPLTKMKALSQVQEPTPEAAMAPPMGEPAPEMPPGGAGRRPPASMDELFGVR